jgi:quinol monooxygenase YgiN
VSEEVSWCVELKIRPGRLEQFHELTGIMVETTRAEPGVLNYQRFVSEDETHVHVFECYESSAAAVAHLRIFADQFGATYSTLVERTKFTVYGNPSDELRALLDQFGAVYMKPFGGFAYW